MIVAGTALMLAMAACKQGSEQTQNAAGRNRFGYRGTAGNATTTFASPSPTPEPFATPKPESQEVTPVTNPTPPPEATPTPAGREMSYGTPVPGKPGFVTSPHSPYAGYVDVRGFPPGTEVKCPYSGKIFLVP